MQRYDFTAKASGASTVVNAPGRYIKYVTGNAGGNDAGLIVTPGGKPGSQIFMYPGMAMTLPDAAPEPNSWTVANAAGAADISGYLVIGNGKIDDDTLSGVVQVVDGGKSRALSGSAFLGMNLTPAPGAGLFQHVQLWNPATSKKRLVVEQIETVSTVATGFNHYATQIQLSTANGAGNPKLFGGAVSTAGLLYKQSNATSLWTGAEMLTNGPANVTSVYKPTEPFVIPPGWGWGVVTQGSNADLTVMWEWYEEPNV